jgi:amidase
MECPLRCGRGYSARGGQTLNAYGPGEFFVGGSSSGSAVAVAANFIMAAAGTETDASILSPCVQNSVVGIKPTVGNVSRKGIIPFTYSQDTAGPIARFVEDAAVLLGIIGGYDKDDPSTYKNEGEIQTDYTKYLDVNGLKGARIGVFRQVEENDFMPGEYDEHLFNQAVYDLGKAGAEIIEDIDIPSFRRKWK